MHIYIYKYIYMHMYIYIYIYIHTYIYIQILHVTGVLEKEGMTNCSTASERKRESVCEWERETERERQYIVAVSHYYNETHSNTLEHTCNALERTTMYCNARQRTSTHGKTRQRTATRGKALQHTAMHCNTHLEEYIPAIDRKPQQL